MGIGKEDHSMGINMIFDIWNFNMKEFTNSPGEVTRRQGLRSQF